MKTIENPFYKANGECVEVDLDTAVLHTQDGEQITEDYLDTLADTAERHHDHDKTSVFVA